MRGRRVRAVVLLVAVIGVRHAPGAEEPGAYEDILWTEEKRFSRAHEEVIIRDFFQDRRDGFFIDIGCSHPRRNSNTYYLEKNLGWTGIGVDGVPDYAKGWAKIRPKSKFLNFMVTERSDAQETFYKVPVWGLSTAEKQIAERMNGVQAIEVPTITLDDLLERNEVKEIDLLTIDVEGHHEAVLAGFDLARWQPKLVCIEEEGPFAVPWFRARGYEPIRRYRARDGSNWYFAPKEDAAAVDARHSEREDEELRRREASLADQPRTSALWTYLNPKYVLDAQGALVLNDRWVAASEALENERADPQVPGVSPARDE